jgi:hypothetical protein
MNISNVSKFFSICLILIVFAFLINNYLTFAGDWPGAFTIYNSANIYSSIQFFLYVSAIIFPLIFIYYNKKLDNLTLANNLERVNDFIIRFGFWSVLIIGIIDALISFLIIEGFLEQMIGKSWNIKFSNNSFRAPYVHFPLLFVFINICILLESSQFLLVSISCCNSRISNCHFKICFFI